MTTATEPHPPGLERTLDGKVALFTGGTRGIGAAISRYLAADGAEAAAGYWRPSEVAGQFPADLSAGHPGRPMTLHHGNIARVVAFLAADESAYITGPDLVRQRRPGHVR